MTLIIILALLCVALVAIIVIQHQTIGWYRDRIVRVTHAAENAMVNCVASLIADFTYNKEGSFAELSAQEKIELTTQATEHLTPMWDAAMRDVL